MQLTETSEHLPSILYVDFVVLIFDMLNINYLSAQLLGM